MSFKSEKIEDNKVKITFSVTPEEFEKGIEFAYKKNKNVFSMQGFRKGRVPRKIVEMNYGKEVFYEDAVNYILPDLYEKAIDELKLDIVSRPEIDLKEVAEEVIITAEVYVKPEVTIDKDDYMNVTYKKQDLEVTEEEINKELDSAREQNARIISIDDKDRIIKDGDIATIDFEGFMDGVAFEGGKGTDYDLTIGSKTFIDTFEEQIVGHKLGDELEVNVTFPENYGKKEFEGKPALFKVKIKEIKSKELPELNDDFAQDVSEFDTLEEYKNDLKSHIEENKSKKAKSEKENEIINQLIEKAKMDVPNVMIENQIDMMVNDFARQIQSQGISLENYLQYVGQTKEALRDIYRENASIQVKGRLVLEAIAKSQDIKVTDEEFNEEIDRIAETYSMEKEKIVQTLKEEDKKNIEEDIKIRKTLDFVLENAKEA